tara:strand:- start:2437 stop:2649 length:213 start_codon:yes stop_codon:yes gene_type:complete
MSIKAEKQLAVLRHQFVKLQKEHLLCEQLVTDLKKDKDTLAEKCKELQSKLDAKTKTTRKRAVKKKEDNK